MQADELVNPMTQGSSFPVKKSSEICKKGMRAKKDQGFTFEK